MGRQTVWMIWMVTAILIGCASSAEFYNGLVLKSVARTIDLSTFAAHQSSNIIILNNGDKPASHFFLTTPENQRNNLAQLTVTSDGAALKVTEVNDVKFPADKKVAAWRVDLPAPLAKDATITVTVTEAYVHQVAPFPKAIAQNDRQLVRYFGNHYFFTPYTATKQRTTVKVAGTIEGKSELTPTSTKDNTITYGPYENVAPFSVSELFAHYENNKPFVTITRLNRDIEVSHWGNVAFEDDLDYQHDGAELKSPFSRFDFQRTAQGPSSVKSLKQVLPLSASEVYYRDEIGNISTSTFAVTPRGLEFEFQPRFPLFGGWKTSHYMGYNVPTQEVLFSSGSNYVLNVSFVEVIDYTTIDHLVVRVILPEGASNIEIKAPIPLKGEKRATHFTYLDTTGRPVAIFEVDNFVPADLQFFQVHYNFSKIALLREPLILVLGFFLFFVSIMVFSRVELRITPAEEKAAVPPRVISLITRARDSARAQTDTLSALNAALKKFLSGNATQTAYAGERKTLELNLGTAANSLGKVAVELEEFDISLAAKVRELSEKLKAKLRVLQQQHDLEVSYKQGRTPQSNYDDTSAQVKKALSQAEDEIEDILHYFADFV